jgi:hypothetical protein
LRGLFPVSIQFVIVQDFDVAAVDGAGGCDDDVCCDEVPAVGFGVVVVGLCYGIVRIVPFGLGVQLLRVE